MSTSAYQWAKPHALFGLKVIAAQPVQPIARPILQPGIGGSFNPAIFFASGEQGVWYDPSDFSTMFQDAAGTTPVTAVEQPVGLMLDKSKGLVLGPELVTNGDFGNGTTGWNLGVGSGSLSIVSDRLRISSTVAGSTTLVATSALSTVAGRTYKVTLGYGYKTAFNQFQVNASNNLNGSGAFSTNNLGGTGTGGISNVVCVFTATAATTYIVLRADTSASNVIGDYVEFDNISVRELPGNHAFQTTSTSRPVLSARYNLLTKTEQFDDAVWVKNAASVTANQAVAPNGTTTADTLTEDAANAIHRVTGEAVSFVAGVGYTVGVYAKIASGTRNLRISQSNGTFINFNTVFNLQSGTVVSGAGQITSLGNGWYWCAVSATSPSSGSSSVAFQLVDGTTVTYTGDGTSGIYLWGADLRVTNDAAGQPAYQRVNTATDYDTTGFKPYMRFDGTDDWLQTNSINFTGTDKMTVFAGVRKLSDAAIATVLETSTDANANSGAFEVRAPAGALNDFFARFRGTGASFVSSPVAAPATRVITAVDDISADNLILRLNGTQVGNSTADQGTGNFGNYPMYIGRRAGTSQPANMRLTGLIAVGSALTAQQITNTENWLNQRTGAF